MCKSGLHPLYVNVDFIAPGHHVMLQNDDLSQRCIQGENTFYLEIMCEGSFYNATVAIKAKIRCINDKHHMHTQYVTWYRQSLRIDLHLVHSGMISITPP
jgi:hypothetical protein